VATFTGHRCPLGLTFDKHGTLGSKFRGTGFVVSWTPGVAAGATGEGPYGDPSQDLLHLELSPLGSNYQVRVTRLVGSFRNPVDAELIDNKLYVLENGGSQGLWEITFPAAPVSLLSEPKWLTNGRFQFTLRGAPDTRYVLDSTSNFLDWRVLSNYNGSETPILFTEPFAPLPYQFYRSRRE